MTVFLVRALTILSLLITSACFAATAAPAATQAAGVEGQYPPGAVRRIGHAEYALPPRFSTAAFTPHGKFIVSIHGSAIVRDEAQILLWDPKTGEKVREVPGKAQSTAGLAFAGDLLVVADDHGVVQLIDLNSGETKKRIETGQPIVGLIVDPAGKRLMAAEDLFAVFRTTRERPRRNPHLLIYDLETGNELQRSELKFSQTRRLYDFMPDNRFLIAAADRSKMYFEIRSIDSGEIVSTKAAGAEARLTTLAWMALSPDHRRLVYQERETYLLDLETGKVETIPKKQPTTKPTTNPTSQLSSRPANPVSWMRTVVSFSPDGNLIARSTDGIVELWDVRALKPLRTITSEAGMPGKIAWSPDSQTLLTYSMAHRMQLWDVKTGNQQNETTIASLNAAAMDVSIDGRTLAVASTSGRILFGDLQSGKVDSPENAQISAARGAPPPVVRFSDDGTKLAALSIRGEVQIWDPAARKIVKKAQMPDGSGTPGLSPDMRRAAITTTQHNIVVWDIDHNKKLQEFAKTKDDSLPGSYLLTNDANSIAFTREKNLERWQLSPPKSEPPVVLADDWLRITLFSRDGKYVTGARPSRTTLWQASDGRELWTADTGELFPRDFDRASRLLLTAANDRLVLLDVANGNTIASIPTERAAEVVACFYPNGRRFVTSSGDGTLLVWDLPKLLVQPDPPDVAPRLLLDQRWKTLDAEDSAAAYQALATLLEKPEQAVQLVRERLEPHGEMNGTCRVERCITLLEWAETPAAVDLLRRFAQCDDRALATPAQAALSRMPQR
jgi:WD40 repeat protein